MHDGRTEEEANNFVLNEAIKTLVNLDQGRKWDGHPVTPVAVFTNADKVEIDGQMVGNSAFPESLFNSRKKLLESGNTYDALHRKDPQFTDQAILFNKHSDRRSHFFMVTAKYQLIIHHIET